MFSRIAGVGLAIIVVGVAIGIIGVARPLASVLQQPVTLVNAAITVDPNDYATQSLMMTTGQTIQVALRIDNLTIFTFDIMNQTQYDVWYNCAPRCHQPLLGGNGSYYQQANERTPTLVNATVSPSSPYLAQFTAPSDATYYLVLDNSIGPTWANYLNQDATNSTMGQLTLTSMQAVTDYGVNWPVIGLGAMVILAGGAIETWWPRPKRTLNNKA
jgi:hypothetical protein